MHRRTLDILTAFSIAASVVAACCLLATAVGWTPQAGEVSLTDVQARLPKHSELGITSSSGPAGLGEISVRLQRYQPLINPAEAPADNREDLFPFTALVLQLHKSWDKYGFSFESAPVFDASHSHLVGEYTEWGIPYWFLLSTTGLLPAARAIRRSIQSRSWPSEASLVCAMTAAALVLFLIGAYDRGWSGEFELISSLLLGAAGLIAAVILAFRNRNWRAAGLNAAYWATIFLVHWAHRP